MADTDAVMNDETRRALQRRVRQIGMVVVGAAVAIVIFGVAGLAAILSIPWQLSLALTTGVTFAIPVAVPYAMLRVLGLSHQDVLYVGKQAYREAVAEVIALSGTRETADVFTESIALGEETENSPSEAEEMNADESSTESESTDLQQQQAEPEPQS
jgi:hypothetical protein